MAHSDRRWLTRFEEGLGNTTTTVATSDPPLEQLVTQTEAATLRHVRDKLGSINEKNFTSLDGNIRFPKDKVITEEGKGVGRSFGVVQTTPERVLGWQFHAESKEGMARHGKANGSRLDKYPNKVIRRINFGHQIIYSCRKLPFPLQPRDWLTRQIFAPLESNLGYVLATIPVSNDDPDVPTGFKRSTLERPPIRGVLESLSMFERLPFGCTKFTYLVRADIGGNTPKVVAESMLSGLLDTVKFAYECFQRDDEVDKLQRDDLVNSIQEAPTITGDERDQLHRCIAYADFGVTAGGGIARRHTTPPGVTQSGPWEKWTRLRDADLAVKKFTKKKEGDSDMWGKATATLHTSAAEAFAWMWFYCSNFRTKQHMKNEGDDVVRSSDLRDTSCHTQQIVVHKPMPLGLSTREVKMRWVWGKYDDKLIIAFEPSSEMISRSPQGKEESKEPKQSPPSAKKRETKSDRKLVQVYDNGVFIFERKSENICGVTMVTRHHDTGILHAKLSNATPTLSRILNIITQVKEFFDRNGLDVDEELRRAFIAKIPEVALSEEKNVLAEKLMEKYPLCDDMWTPLNHDSTAFIKLSKSCNRRRDVALGRAEATVDASAEEVLAWVFAHDSNERLAAGKLLSQHPIDCFYADDDCSECELSTVLSLPRPLSNRHSLVRSFWTKRPDGSFVVAWTNLEATKGGNQELNIGMNKSSNLVRAFSEGYVLLTNTRDATTKHETCRVVWVQKVDLKGSVPRKITEMNIPLALRVIVEIHDKFSRDEEVDQTERDKLVAVMWRDKEEYSESEVAFVDAILKRTASLRENSFENIGNSENGVNMR